MDEAEVEYRFHVGARKVQFMLGPAERETVCAWLRHYRTKEPLEIQTPTMRLSRAIRPAADPQTTPPSYGVALDWPGNHIELSDDTVKAWSSDLAQDTVGMYQADSYLRP